LPQRGRRLLLRLHLELDAHPSAWSFAVEVEVRAQALAFVDGLTRDVVVGVGSLDEHVQLDVQPQFPTAARPVRRVDPVLVVLEVLKYQLEEFLTGHDGRSRSGRSRLVEAAGLLLKLFHLDVLVLARRPAAGDRAGPVRIHGTSPLRVGLVWATGEL